MYISAIGKESIRYHKNNEQPQFKGLITDRSALPIIDSFSKSEKLEFEAIKKRLSGTKFWDLKISSIGNRFREFKFEFIDKKNKHGIITDGIHPCCLTDDTIKVYSIIYGPENISKNVIETLRFKSKERAAIVYNNYEQNLEMVRNKRFNLTPIESLRSKEIELNMLEEAANTPNTSKDLSYETSTEITTKNYVGNSYKI